MIMMKERRISSAWSLGRPAEARGIIPLILGALAVGRGIYGAIEANQQKQRNKGYINDAYRSAQARQTLHEGDVRQGEMESLASRGIMSTADVPSTQSRIAAAMNPQSAKISGATSLAGRDLLESDQGLALERHDLDAAHTQALNENKADALNAEIASLGQGAQGVVSAAGAAGDLSAMQKLGATGSVAAASPPAGNAPPASSMDLNAPLDLSGSSRIGAAMGQGPGGHWGGIDAVSPLEHPDSNWNPNKGSTVNGAGAANSDFHL